MQFIIYHRVFYAHYATDSRTENARTHTGVNQRRVISDAAAREVAETIAEQRGARGGER